MTSYECADEAFAYAAELLADLGYEVTAEEEPGHKRLVIERGSRRLQITVLGSADGLWMLAARGAGGRPAIDVWLSERQADEFFMLVQFRGMSGVKSPRAYIARPAKIAAQATAKTTGRGPALLKEPLPASWRFPGEIGDRRTLGNSVSALAAESKD